MVRCWNEGEGRSKTLQFASSLSDTTVIGVLLLLSSTELLRPLKIQIVDSSLLEYAQTHRPPRLRTQ